MVKAVVGANWGDEGKGKITDMLAQDADIVVRFQETTYTPNAEWNDIFLEGLDNVKNDSMTVDEYIEQVAPKMQESLDEAWESVE